MHRRSSRTNLYPPGILELETGVSLARFRHGLVRPALSDRTTILRDDDHGRFTRISARLRALSGAGAAATRGLAHADTV
ncbi:MAG: hypothetical protein ACOCY0_03550 [Roseicyclus sp.]